MEGVALRFRSGSVACLLAAMCLGGCSRSTTYQIEGAGGDFCVPAAIDATYGYFLSPAIVDEGFAMRGCWNPGTSACRGPDVLISMAVGEASDFTGWRFIDMPSDAHIPQVAVREAGNARQLSPQVLAIPDAMYRDGWFIWRLEGIPHSAIGGSDELMATCDAIPEYKGYSCKRYTMGPGYSLIYSYFSHELPTSFKALDQRIIEVVESLRCEKSGVSP